MKKESSEIIRQCVVTRERLSVNELIRFVSGPDNEVVPDLKRKLPGRGVWVTANANVVKTAIKRHLFNKAFQQSVMVGDDLVGLIDQMLQNSALQQLSFVNKAGQLITGFSKVDAALDKKNIIGLIHASAASTDSCRKLDNKWRYLRENEDAASRIVLCFSSEQLSYTLGRPNVVHAALKEGGASSAFLDAVAQIRRYNLDS